MLFAVGFIVTFTIGGISGVMHAMSSSDAQQQDTYFIVAHFHYVLFGGAIMGIFGAIYYWFPKYAGRMYNEAEGKWHFWLMFIGQNLTFFPMHFIGMDGMPPPDLHVRAPDMGWTELNALQTAGAFRDSACDPDHDEEPVAELAVGKPRPRRSLGRQDT